MTVPHFFGELLPPKELLSAWGAGVQAVGSVFLTIIKNRKIRYKMKIFY